MSKNKYKLLKGRQIMNGYECGSCDCSPCVCAEVERNKRIKEGKVVIESMWQAMAHLSRWRMKLVQWLWPDIIDVAKDLQEYYWK